MEARSADGLTSGKVPLEKTLQATELAAGRHREGAHVRGGHVGQDVHEQTSLSTGAVTDNNELSADLSHGEDGGAGGWGCCGGVGSLLREQKS